MVRAACGYGGRGRVAHRASTVKPYWRIAPWLAISGIVCATNTIREGMVAAVGMLLAPDNAQKERNGEQGVR